MPLTSPRLWIVATPIGNPGDFSLRTREVLAGADLILAEDTRRALALLDKAGIQPRRLLSFFEHNEERRQQQVLAELTAGKNIALITDAGTPLLSDPGYRLVRACRKANLPVSPVPGPSAVLAALSACGLAPLPFTFLGFLPRGEKARLDLLAAYGAFPGSIVFFERKDRVAETLNLAARALGQREFALCRELTKEHEEFILGRLGEKLEPAQILRGEITVVIGPREACGRTPQAEAEKLLQTALADGHRGKVVAKMVKDQCRGWSVAELYNLLIKLSGKPAS